MQIYLASTFSMYKRKSPPKFLLSQYSALLYTRRRNFCVFDRSHRWEDTKVYKVLLVDDEILVREAISAKIEWGHLGFELVGDCENGKAAIEFLKENPVDVVLTDIMKICRRQESLFSAVTVILNMQSRQFSIKSQSTC